MSTREPLPEIQIAASATPGAYLVSVRTHAATQHRVTVSPAYLAELGLAAQPAATVLHAAFRFLLEREPNTSILSRFDLRDIERYFPEFRREIARRL